MTDELRKFWDRFHMYRRAERHRTVDETRYWLDQYKILCNEMILALAAKTEAPAVTVESIVDYTYMDCVKRYGEPTGFRKKFDDPTIMNCFPAQWEPCSKEEYDHIIKTKPAHTKAQAIFIFEMK